MVPSFGHMILSLVTLYSITKFFPNKLFKFALRREGKRSEPASYHKIITEISISTPNASVRYMEIGE